MTGEVSRQAGRPTETIVNGSQTLVLKGSNLAREGRGENGREWISRSFPAKWPEGCGKPQEKYLLRACGVRWRNR